MSDPRPSARKVRCPTCGTEASFSPDNPHRPFCSARCRLVDLGQWATEAYRVPIAPETDENGELPGESLS